MANRVWKSWAPLRCKYFIWLVSLNKCWTTYQLARRELDHPECCVFCDQDEKTVQHLLVACDFYRQVWFEVLSSSLARYLGTSTFRIGGFKRTIPNRSKKDLIQWLFGLVVIETSIFLCVWGWQVGHLEGAAEHQGWHKGLVSYGGFRSNRDLTRV